MALSAKDILSKDDLKTEVVAVPEWGGEVIVATMSGEARDAYEMSVIDKNGEANLKNIRAKLLVATLVDEDGNRLFSEADVQKLGKKSGAALDRIFAVAQRLNAVTDNDIEELAKN